MVLKSLKCDNNDYNFLLIADTWYLSSETNFIYKTFIFNSILSFIYNDLENELTSTNFYTFKTDYESLDLNIV